MNLMRFFLAALDLDRSYFIPGKMILKDAIRSNAQ